MRETIVAVALAGSAGLGVAQGADDARLQACSAVMAREAEMPPASVRTDQEVTFADGTYIAKLEAGMAGGVCWADAKGKVAKVALAEPKSGADAAKAKACAVEAAKSGNVALKEVQDQWWSEGPDGIVWIRLQVKDRQADCLLDGKGVVREVVFAGPR